MDFLGISPAVLGLSILAIVVMLLLVFTFIFLGISAFTLGGTLGSVINGALPMGNNSIIY
jgi:hypothetical protein